MGLLPIDSEDFFDAASGLLESNESTGAIPATSGLGTRQSKIQNERIAQTTRKIMHWLIPEGPIVQMYINPQQVRYGYKKAITHDRTKGGFSVQYWGEELIQIAIDGTTGTSGIEGINVLNDVYRNEQLAFEPYALYLAQQYKENSFAGDIFGIGSDLFSGEGFVAALLGGAESPVPQSAPQGPSLGELAVKIELYWSGEVYRGFFTDFNVTESAQNLGMFDYNINFLATQKRGMRQNFLGWHRSAVSGPSNSDPTFGPPHSFKDLIK